MTLHSYYIELGSGAGRIFKAFDFDDYGIPRYKYKDGLMYNITFIGHFALYQLSVYQRFNTLENLKYFFKIADWILTYGQELDGCFFYPYQFRWQHMEPPWISAIGQGRILSVLSRAYEISGKKKYLYTARKVLKTFEIPVDKGGLKVLFPDGKIAFEEYPKKGLPNIVLNGLITSMFGIYDLSRTPGEEKALQLWQESITSLASNLHRYDLGYWSAYNLNGKIRHISEKGYHNLHIKQLWSLYEATGIETFRDYADRWEKCNRNFKVMFFYVLSRTYNRMLRLKGFHHTKQATSD